MSTKGSWPRLQSVTNEELELRKQFMRGEINKDQYDRKWRTLIKHGLIKRNGRVIE